MTTNVQIPYNSYIGNAAITTYAFTWSFVETSDILVLKNQLLQSPFSDYIFSDLTDDGGNVVFSIAPESGSELIILRKTDITQNVDYLEGVPFPAETHEFNLDKITYILQELLTGVRDGGLDEDGNPIFLTFDLSVLQAESLLTILNTGGTDAPLPVWVSALFAGVYHGEITESAPADGAATNKPDGYIYHEVLP